MTGRPGGWSVRGPLVTGLVAVMVLVLGIGGWAVGTTLAGAVVAVGRIEVERNRQAIQHPEGGRVAALLVGEGDRVAAGDVVLRLEPGLLARDLAVAEAQLFELRLRRARLEAERDGAAGIGFAAALLAAAAADPDRADLMQGQVNLFEARAESQTRAARQLESRIARISAQIAALQVQERALADQRDLVQTDLDRQEDLLARGLIPLDPVTRLRREDAQLRGALGEVSAQQAEAAERAIETELAILQLETTRREEAIAELREVRVGEEELRRRVTDLERRIAELALRAPVAGRIIGLQVPGAQAVLRAADPAAFVVPEGRALIITARVPALDVDAVYPGQPVSLRFPAFDMRTLPDLTGTVSQVSADAFVDEATGAAFYRAEITLGEGEVARLGARRLLPGMPVEVFIRTGDRTPLSYLVEPISVYFGRALRES